MSQRFERTPDLIRGIERLERFEPSRPKVIPLSEFKARLIAAQRSFDEAEVKRLLGSYRSCDEGAIHVDHVASYNAAKERMERQQAKFFAERLSPSKPPFIGVGG